VIRLLLDKEELIYQADKKPGFHLLEHFILILIFTY